jgi:hypothetical protein
MADDCLGFGLFDGGLRKYERIGLAFHIVANLRSRRCFCTYTLTFKGGAN